MARKKETILHPLQAIEGLGQFNADVGFLLATAQLMLTPEVSGINAVCREKLLGAIDRVRRHYQSNDE